MENYNLNKNNLYQNDGILTPEIMVDIYNHYRYECVKEFIEDNNESFDPLYLQSLTSSACEMMDDYSGIDESNAIYESRLNIPIYQVWQTDADNVFRDFDEKNFDVTTYKLKYTNLYNGEGLENLFSLHNRDDRPFRDKIRSMSVSDIIFIKAPFASDLENEETGAFYVEESGFRKIEPKFFIDYFYSR